MRLTLLCLAAALAAPAASAQSWLDADSTSRTNRSIFRSLDLPDPNVFRAASGQPGAAYWQQRADYVIRTQLDTVAHRVSGTERITYTNNSPDALPFLFVQLDQNNISREHSPAYPAARALPATVSARARAFAANEPFDGGNEIRRVQIVTTPATAAIGSGRLVDAEYRVIGTVMKVTLPAPLRAGARMQFEIDWAYNIPDNERGGKEKLADGWLYEIAQWFPRMSVYDDVNGWQTEPFYGQGEFYLNFGSYDVSITVPWNHIVDATGTLQNPNDVLTATQRQRLAAAYTSETPVFIVRADEVMTAASRPRTSGMLTWRFTADNVRDFAWVSSKTYVWDAAGFRYAEEPGRTIQVHSLYPRAAMPLWDKVSTRATLQTLKTYGRMAFRYPYPKAVNVHGPVFGMEYPMIAFCGARPGADGTYSEGLERSLIGVTVHEVGHNWFPMIVASDERKWTWMDEGLNTFLQFYGENDYARTYTGTAWTQTPDGDYPDRFQRGPAKNIVNYMRDADQVPIMTESDLIHRQFGNNGYSKPATGLWILREHVLGPKAFDEGFQFYANGWKFKHPQPADFFRSMNEGTGENLDWFWRGWFYSTNANDQSIASVTVSPRDSVTTRTDVGPYYVRVDVRNEGGLVMPIEMDIVYADGSKERVRLPASVWRSNERSFVKGAFARAMPVAVVLDPDESYADVDRSDNLWRGPGVTDEMLGAAGLTAPPATVAPAMLARFAGTYEVPGAGLRLSVAVQNGRVVMTIPGQGSFPLAAVDATRLRFEEAGIDFVLRMSPAGAVEGLQASGAQSFYAARVTTAP